MILPADFTDNMKSLLGCEYDAFIKSYDNRPYSAIRVNTRKIGVEDFKKIAPYEIEQTDFVSEGFYINDTDAWSKHPYYYAGLYYIQEPSAMLPAAILEADREDAVLDLCAAPGGKSTQLSCFRPRVLVSNDISFSRSMALVRNIEMSGTCAIVTCAEPEVLSEKFPMYFDRILVDAPCSGEGMFRKDSSLVKEYESRGSAYYAPIQSSILESAYRMLRPGGLMMYSTCTFSDKEDESMIVAFLSSHEDLSVIPIPDSFGLSCPYEKYKGCTQIDNTRHAFPHRFKGEGHFTALIQKAGRYEDIPKEYDFTGLISYGDLPKEAKQFFDGFAHPFKDKLSEKHFRLGRDGFLYMLDEDMIPYIKKGIRYVRTGICAGHFKRSGSFIPKTSLALAVSKEDHGNVVDIGSSDPAILKYLKGETIVAGDISNGKDIHKGFVLVCTDGYPLGFAVYDGMKLKNLYEKGWVMR